MTDVLKRVPTQLDIARTAGVSTATVSRVLNRSPLVKAEMREHVEAIIAEHGYYPHAAARALASNRTYTIGAVIPTLNNAIFAATVNSLERELQEADYTLLVAVSNYDLHSEETQVRRLLERGVEGLFLVGNDHTEAVYQALRRARTTYVNTWAYDPRLRRPNIGFSNRAATRALVDYLLGLGHRRIGMIAGIGTGNDRARDRLAAVKERLGEHGFSLAFETEASYAIRDGRRVLAELIEHNNLPTALICGNDVIALGALFEAMERGVPVPERLSITGFDNLPLTEHIRPAITTVNVPAKEMGAAAGKALLSAIAKGGRVRSREIPAPLLVRETTAPPSRI